MTLETQTILLALLGAFIMSLTNITLTIPLRNMGSFALVQLNNVGNVVLLGAIGLWRFDSEGFRWEAFAWFALLGVINFSLNRWIFYTGLNVMGPSRHITIGSLTPLLSLGFAVFLLGERPGEFVLAGTFLVVAGAVAVSYERTEGRWFRPGIGWSVTSVLFFSFSVYVRHRGMSYMAAPALLTAWGALVAIPTGELIRPLLPKRFFEWGDAKRVSHLILLGALLNGIGQITVNQAMRGKLSLAVPILSSSPVFVLLLSALFLRKIERLNRRVIIGVLVAVAGMIIIGIGRHN
ncbi:MAG: DMT family transporter [Nitrospinota bacterium]|nr:hypothetical protein [Nitrospinota bacterium]MDP6364544.1 DMT family transporter [Nitrospinota bacterium]